LPAGVLSNNVYIMMVRIQITLDPELQARARRKAAEYGISFAEYVRRLIARDLGEPAGPADPSVVFNLGDSGGSDIAREKNRRVAEAVEAEYQRRGRRP
jgi:hypothetical protein